MTGEYIFKALAHLKYDAIGLGERDFLPGVNYLQNLKKNFNLPFLAANVFQPDGNELIFPGYMIKELNGFQHGDTFIPKVRVGIFSVMLYRAQLTYGNNDPKLVMTDPIDAAKNILAQIKDRCDIIIGLVHLPYSQLTNFIQEVQGIDVVITGHDPIMRIDIQKIENTLVIAGGNRGQYIGDLRLVLNQQHKIIDYEGTVATLDEKIKDDPEILKIIKEHKEQEANISYELNRDRYRTMEMYVGAKKCKECHNDQYLHWQKSRHARAFETLIKKAKQDDVQCAQCHTTGFAQYNGFYNYLETPEMADVQCEACHGIGKLHVQSVERIKSQKLKAAILAPISEETCVGCHDKSQDP
ncbi:MAG: hypothetical protein MUC94_04595, partial [bacterium]|nr:hypothetical protein [bacterium]